MSKILLLGLLAGCLPAPVSSDTSVGLDDTGGSTGDDTDDTDGIPLTGTLRLQPGTAPLTEEAMVGLVLVVNDGSALSTSLSLVTTSSMSLTEDAESWSLALPATLEDSWLMELPTGERAAEFVLAAWTERTGDDGPDATDVMVGANLQTLSFIQGTPSSELAALGLQQGWNRLSRDLLQNEAPTSAAPISASGLEVSLTSNLLPRHPNSLGGFASLDLDGMSVSAIDFVDHCFGSRQGDTYATTRVEDGTFEFAWTEAAPPEELFSTELLDNCGESGLPPVGVEGALFELVAYLDVNGDEAQSSGEVAVSRSTESGSVGGSVLVYLHPVNPMAVAYTQQGGFMGWQRIGIGGLGIAPFLEWNGTDL